MSLTFIEYRIKRAELSAEYRAKLAALDAAYAGADKSAAKADRVSAARAVAASKRLDKGAAQWLTMLDGRLESPIGCRWINPADKAQLERAIEMSEGRYTLRFVGAYRDAEVTRIVTK